MATDRRQFLAGTAATAALAAAPAGAQPTPLPRLFDALVQAQLRRSPEQATNLGLDTGANADLRAKLSDQSAAGVAAAKAQTLAACSYKLGHSVFADLREKAKAKQGARFDIRAFHTAVLRHGRLPLDVLRDIE